MRDVPFRWFGGARPRAYPSVMSQAGPSSLFVGRELEVRQLIEGLDEAASGRGRLFVVAGEPGVGKSRLADEVTDTARERGHLVLWGRGWEDAGTPAYWPWVQVLRSYLRSVGAAAAIERMGTGAIDISRMLPEIRGHRPDLPPPPDVDPDAARFQLFDSTVTFLREAAAETPLLIVLDDIQAADTPSILLLRFLTSQVADARILLLATYRQMELAYDHPGVAAINDLAREPRSTFVRLEGLPPDDTARFVEVAGVTPHASLVHALWQGTGGNPLFLGEALRLLSAEGRLDDMGRGGSVKLSVPSGIRDVILRRAAHLGEQSGELLSRAAAIGPEFGIEVLRRVWDGEGGAVLPLLEAAVRAGLLAQVEGAPGNFRFAHGLIRESFYGELSALRRAELHLRIASVLDDLYASGLDTHLSEVAYHYVEGAKGSALDTALRRSVDASRRAIDYARRAGDQAVRSSAYEEAVRLYRMALAVLETDLNPDDKLRIELLIAIGDAEARANDLDVARETFIEAAEHARRIGAPEPLARAALGYGGRFVWAREGNDPRLTPLLQDALVLLGGQDDRLRVRLLARLACAWRSSPTQREQGAALSKQAVDIARELGDPHTLSYALTGRAWAIWWADNAEERIAIASEMLAIAQSLGDVERQVDAQSMLCLSYIDLGQLDRARAETDDLRRLAEPLRQPAQAWSATVPRITLDLAFGEFDRAEASMAEETMPGHPTTPAHDDVSAARMHRFLRARETGTLADEEAGVRAAADEFRWYPLHRSALACLLLELDRRVEARAVFDGLAQDDFAALYHDSEWLLGTSLAAEACHGLEDRDAAAVLYEQLVPHAGRHAVGHPEGSVGAVDRYLGMLAWTLGRPDDAERHFTDALRLNKRMRIRPWIAHVQHDLARLLISRGRAGDPARAHELVRDALATANALGMTVLAGRLQRLEAMEPPSTPPPSSAAVFRREGEYWTIAFGGDSLRVRDSKGMGYLARLFAAPGKEMHAMDLAGGGGGDAARVAHGRDDGLSVGSLGNAGFVLDANAKAAYRERLTELASEVAGAEATGDVERGSRASQDLDFLRRELAGAVGLGGRDRAAASSAERARISVTRALRSAIDRLAEHNAALGEHLASTVRTGTYCSYRPDSRVAIQWEL
jgi:tetratricopeptide (TPR) repeat protein